MSETSSICDTCGVVEKLDQVLARLNEINRAFPDGPEPHRIAHESMIKASAAQERFWNELKLDIAKKGLWGLLVIIVGLALTGILVKFGVAAAIVK